MSIVNIGAANGASPRSIPPPRAWGLPSLGRKKYQILLLAAAIASARDLARFPASPPRAS
jgi:hypothetical protein|eukprot:31342-Pelagococcus_subviridis.AAC.3